MAGRVRCSDWKKDEDFVSRDYPEYAWSLPTLSRRLNILGIKYIRYETSVEHVKEAAQEEMESPGQYLGYRAMQRKIRKNINWLFLVIWSMMCWVWLTPKDWRDEGMLVRRNGKGELQEPSLHWQDLGNL